MKFTLSSDKLKNDITLAVFCSKHTTEDEDIMFYMLLRYCNLSKGVYTKVHRGTYNPYITFKKEMCLMRKPSFQTSTHCYVLGMVVVKHYFELFFEVSDYDKSKKNRDGYYLCIESFTERELNVIKTELIKALSKPKRNKKADFSFIKFI